MKAVNSSSYSSSSLLRIMIPQFQQLLPLETTLSGSWSNPSYSSESSSTANKLVTPPISSTPSSICTDLSDSEYQPIDLSSSRKYSLSTPPLSNIKVESIDFIDYLSPHLKQESMVIITNDEKYLLDKSKSMKKSSNFTIEHLLSSAFPSRITYHYLTIPSKQVQSIFTKKKIKQHFSDHYLHRIVHHRKRLKQKIHKSSLSHYSQSPRGIFIPYVLDIVKELINQQNQINYDEKFVNVDALEQLAEIACKLDPRHRRSIVNEDKLTSKAYQSLLKQCHLLTKQIYQKYQQKTFVKRLYYDSKSNLKRHMVHFPVSILNLLLMKKNIVLNQSNHSDCYISTTSDSENDSIKKEKTTESTCFHLTPDQIIANLEILLPNNGLVYEGTIQPIDNFDDLLLIRLNHERQTYLIPSHDLCRLSCPKLIPTNFDFLANGSRVCAYWSTSLRGLHPAIVKQIPSEINPLSVATLLFDDGDMGLIKLDEIRLLPETYKIEGIHLEEWRVSSFQIPPSISTSRRASSSSSIVSTNTSIKKLKKSKTSSSSPSIVIPQWTLNTRNSTICRRDTKEVLRSGDCIILHGTDQSLSYIGKVLKFYRNRLTQQDSIRLKWYYSPQETLTGLHENDLPGALYESTHTDENPIATIRYKGTIYQSYDDYVKQTDYGKNRKDTDFYLVGYYDPVSGELQRYDNKSKEKADILL